VFFHDQENWEFVLGREEEKGFGEKREMGVDREA
jgi:hypothetical protein